MPPKSRAAEARKRRRLQREMRRILDTAAILNEESSDDDIRGPVPSASTVQGINIQPSQEEMGIEGVRLLQGRRVLFGVQRIAPIQCDESSANNASFSEDASLDDNVVRQHSADDVSDSSNDDMVQTISSTDLSADNDTDNSMDDVPLRQQIADFVQNHSLSVVATSELLHLFTLAGVHGLPKDRRSLLRTKRTIDVVQMCGGTYKYLGLRTGLIDFLSTHPQYFMQSDTLSFTVNLDGVPLYKSCNSQFWPLLCQVRRNDPFVVAIYYGEKKPDNIGDFLHEFIAEYNELRQSGIDYGNHNYGVKLVCWICDAPARSLLKNIKGHSGFYACERCKVKGTHTNHRVTYPGNLIFESRTDNEFIAMAYHDPPHGDTHQNGLRCPLPDAQMLPVSEVVIDVMHNVYLGTWKRMLHFIMSGPRRFCRLSMNQKTQINDKLLRLRLPQEFARQPRSIFELDRWKATELRSSLLYTGYIFFKGILTPNLYELYVRLSVAMSILHSCDNDFRNRFLDYARQLILEFIRDAEHLLGQDFIVYNVHTMSHIPDDVAKFQCSVNDICAFPYENHLQVIKKMVRTPKNPLAQVCARLDEKNHILIRKEKKKCEAYISTREKDSVFFFKERKEFALIQRKRRDGRYDVLLLSAAMTEDYFTRPLPSKTVNIFLVRRLNQQPVTPKIVPKQALHHKVVLLPCENGVDYLLIPMLHDGEVYRTS